ncbi:transcriptional regulator, partial [Streptomyces sp. 7-21]|nr:transcriptional regulator [Streptomyces sp. 7-21]
MASRQPDPASSVRDLLAGPQGGPTVLRIVLGTHLRRLRESRGISREAAGE